jgi:hypothetical protein
MFSITLKRSAAALGVAAGLLAAAGPASAMDYMGSPVVTYSVKAPTTPTANGFGLSFEHIDMNARTNAGTQVGSEGVKAPTGTQIGIED